jgi:hypothetical protein
MNEIGYCRNVSQAEQDYTLANNKSKKINELTRYRGNSLKEA